MFRFKGYLALQKKFYKNTFLPTIVDKAPQAYALLSQYDLNRMQKYAIMVPAMAGESYCVLRAKRLSDTERMGLTALGALTAMFDDLFDVYKYSYESVYNLLYHSSLSNSFTPLEEVMVAIFRVLQNCVRNKTMFEKELQRVLEFQHKARELQHQNATNSTLQTFMNNKGEASMLLYRSVFSIASKS